MTRLGVVAAFAVAFIGVGCADKPDGVLLVISAEAGAEPAALYVAVGSGLDDVTFANVRNGEVVTHIHDKLGDEPIPLEGRDLAADPFRYFIRSGEEKTLDIAVVGVIGPNEDDFEVVSLQLVRGASFMPGVVHQYDVHLLAAQPPDGEILEGSRTCVRSRLAPDSELIIVTRGTDYDCDGWEAEGPVGEYDCAPKDGFIHPDAIDVCEVGRPPVDNNCNERCDEQSQGGIACNTAWDDEGERCERVCLIEPENGISESEVCDGFDSDCNELTEPHDAETPCFGRAEDNMLCAFGTKGCDDTEGGEANEMCDVNIAAELPFEFCEKYDECFAEDVPGSKLDCAYDRLDVKTVHCGLAFQADGAPCSFAVPIDANANTLAECGIEIFDPRTEAFALPSILGSPLNDCDARALTFDQGQGQPASFELLLAEGVPGERRFVRVTVDAYQVENCSPDGSVSRHCDGDIKF